MQLVSISFDLGFKSWDEVKFLWILLFGQHAIPAKELEVSNSDRTFEA